MRIHTILGCAAVTIFFLLSTTVPNGAVEADEVNNSRLDANGDLLATLHAIYDHGGWSHRDAASLAVRALGVLRKEPVQPFTPTQPVDEGVVSLLSPNSDPLATLHTAFRLSGWTNQEAAELASIMVADYLNGDQAKRGPQPEGLAFCWVYNLKIFYCVDGQLQHQYRYIPKNCWENNVKEVCPLGIACEEPDVPYYHLTPYCLNLPCAWVTDQGEGPSAIPCEDVINPVSCHCFSDPFGGGPIDCEGANPICCDSYYGCNEDCPCHP